MEDDHNTSIKLTSGYEEVCNLRFNLLPNTVIVGSSMEKELHFPVFYW